MPHWRRQAATLLPRVLPDVEARWGPYGPQELHVWLPAVPNQASAVVLVFTGGGFAAHPPLADLGPVPPSNPQGPLKDVLRRLVERRGYVVACPGVTGADGDSPRENRGRGVWRPSGHPDWHAGPETTWYYKDAVLATRLLRAIQGDPDFLVAMGFSAGAMQAMQPEVAADAVVALNMPVSWPALEQERRHVLHSYLPDAATGEPVEVVGDAAFADQVGASIDVFGPGAIFFASDYAAQLGPLDFDPRDGVLDVLAEIHDLGQLQWAFLARDAPDDELWVHRDHAAGRRMENVFSGRDVRSRGLLAEVERWIVERVRSGP